MIVSTLEHRLLGGFYNDTKLLKSPSNLCSRGETIVIVTSLAEINNFGSNFIFALQKLICILDLCLTYLYVLIETQIHVFEKTKCSYLLLQSFILFH